MSELKDEERIIEARLQPDSPRTHTETLSVPFGEVWRVIDIVSLDMASPDFELALHKNGVRQGAVHALTVYAGNGSRPMSDVFKNCPIYHGHLAYFVATPLLPVTEAVSVKFRLKVRRSLDEMLVKSSQSA
jgi:hypothetical protein